MADRRHWDHSLRDRYEEARQSTADQHSLYESAFRAACEDCRARIVRLRSPWIMEDISEHVRAWFREMWLASGETDFDTFPPEAKGGTILVLRGMTSSPWEFVEELKQREILAKMTPAQRKQLADAAKKAKAAEKLALKKAKQKKREELAKRKKMEAKSGKTWDFAGEQLVSKNFGEKERDTWRGG